MNLGKETAAVSARAYLRAIRIRGAGVAAVLVAAAGSCIWANGAIEAGAVASAKVDGSHLHGSTYGALGTTPTRAGAPPLAGSHPAGART
jgi:hypothetical protein